MRFFDKAHLRWNVWIVSVTVKMRLIAFGRVWRFDWR